MVRELAQTLHVAPTLLYTIIVAVLLISALGLGFALNRLFHYWTKKHRNTWGEYFFALLEPLPLPLLVLAALYIGLELLTLPQTYDRIIAKVIFALVILILCYFPAKIVILLLRRMGQRDPALEQVAQPFPTRTVQLDDATRGLLLKRESDSQTSARVGEEVRP